MIDNTLNLENTYAIEPNEFGIFANGYTPYQLAILSNAPFLEHDLERSIELEEEGACIPLIPNRVMWEGDPTVDGTYFTVYVEAVFPNHTFSLNGNTPESLKEVGRNQIIKKVNAHGCGKLPKEELWYKTANGNKLFYVKSKTPVPEDTHE